MAILEFDTLGDLEGHAKLFKNYENRYALLTNVGVKRGGDDRTPYFVVLRPTVSSDLDTLVVHLEVDPKELAQGI